MSAVPVFCLVYTSARPGLIAGVLDEWFARAAHPARVVAVVSVDAPDEAAGRAAVARCRRADAVDFVVNPGPRTCVAGWNAAAQVARGDVLVAISDDFGAPAGWDDALQAAGPAGWWEEDRAVAVDDGNNPDLFTLAILTRRRFERYGYLFHPAYASMFCDTEFTVQALAEQAVIDARHLVFEHRHPTVGKRSADAVDKAHNSEDRFRAGSEIFEARQRAGFPREWPAPPVVAGRREFALYVQCNKDDFCLFEVCHRILKEQRPPGLVIGAVYLFCPDEYWSGQKTSAAESAEVGAVAAKLRERWPRVEVNFRMQTIAPMRVAAGNRLEVETRARNAAVAEMRRAGYQHILVADGDELWRTGLLARLARFVARHGPAGVLSKMVPVVGLPGYPVEGARDHATIYLGPHAYFIKCRRVCGTRVYLPGRDVIHFTATRRTMEEIARKHRDSGHYDDPDYDFEGWIKDVLPRLRPGWKGAHMYRRKQIWPLVRGWSPGELADIPESLRPFLGTQIDPAWKRLCRRLGWRVS